MFFEHMKAGEELQVSNLIWEVFTEFEAPDYKQAGIDEFKKFILPEKIKANSEAGRLSFLCCKENNEIIGVLAIRGNRHISLLFVKKEYQRKGIARELFEIAVEICRKSNPYLKDITVNSSPYAVVIYEKLGFKRTDVDEEINGIRFIPMKFNISGGAMGKGYSN